MTIRKGRAFRLITGGLLGTNQVRWASIRKNTPGHRVPGMCKGKKLSEVQEVATSLRIPLRTRRDGKGKLVPKRKAQLCATIRRKVGGNTTVVREQLKKLNRKVSKASKKTAKKLRAKKAQPQTAPTTKKRVVKYNILGASKLLRIPVKDKTTAQLRKEIMAKVREQQIRNFKKKYGRKSIGELDKKTLVRKLDNIKYLPRLRVAKKAPVKKARKVATNLTVPNKKVRKVRSNKGVKRGPRGSKATNINNVPLSKLIETINAEAPKKARKVRSNKGVKRGPRGSKATNINNVPLSNLIETINAEAPKKARKVRSNKGVKRGPRGSKKNNNNIPVNKLIKTINESPKKPTHIRFTNSVNNMKFLNSAQKNRVKNNLKNATNAQEKNRILANAKKLNSREGKKPVNSNSNSNSNNNSNNFYIDGFNSMENAINNSMATLNWNKAFASMRTGKMSQQELNQMHKNVANAQRRRFGSVISRYNNSKPDPLSNAEFERRSRKSKFKKN